MRDLLRSLPVFAGSIRDLTTDDLPCDPADLFADWLSEAVEEGVIEPHAMTLSTTDAFGMPDARVLLLKDLNAMGWWFATNSTSPKGAQLADQPAAALTFYWPQVARQVRVRGTVSPGPEQVSAADFRSRGATARAVALASLESQPLESRLTCVSAVGAAQQRLREEPDLISPSWHTYVLAPRTVEFWQADKDRLHTRVQYQHHMDTWTHGLLWP